jgi:hypothetical protein
MPVEFVFYNRRGRDTRLSANGENISYHREQAIITKQGPSRFTCQSISV